MGDEVLERPDRLQRLVPEDPIVLDGAVYLVGRDVEIPGGRLVDLQRERQPFLVRAKRFADGALVLDIGVRSEPLDDLALLVAQRQRARVEPAEGPVGSPCEMITKTPGNSIIDISPFSTATPPIMSMKKRRSASTSLTIR